MEEQNIIRAIRAARHLAKVDDAREASDAMKALDEILGGMPAKGIRVTMKLFFNATRGDQTAEAKNADGLALAHLCSGALRAFEAREQKGFL